ncbi:RdRp [Beihai barnacle virus 12]|uniref:RdRp n=1 Tax=Beihai barnacle virus 12 TaxID=1922356 RepID=UPI000909522D|nr:RdRp [Beihai barnacle virus 12]APG78177.1 RdRp [Beihai barnacle virus 12]
MLSLQPGESFRQDFRNPGRDKLATEALNHAFGSDRVDKILATLHRAEKSLDELIADVMLFDRERVGPAARDDPVYQLALESVRQEFIPKETKVIPLTLGGVENRPDLPRNKSPGLPLNEHFKTKGEALSDPGVHADIHKKWALIGKGYKQKLHDSALFQRAQICSTEKNKIRAVWGYPLEVFMEEARFFYPYMDYILSCAQNLPIGYQAEMATGGMLYINDMIRSHPHATFAICDWSRFDKTVPAWLIRDAFQIILDSLDLSKVQGSDGAIWNVREEDSLRRFKRVVSYFINTPIRSPDGSRFRKRGGVPSGSAFTNIIDSIVNAIVTRYLAYHCSGALPSADIYLGDDSVCVVNGVVNLQDWADLAREKFSMELNVEKSYVTTNPCNVHFLGYFNLQGLPIKGQDFAMASFLYPERKSLSPTITAARALGQMWSTMNPYAASNWHDVVTYIMDTQDVTLSQIQEHLRSQPEAFRYLRMMGLDVATLGLPRKVDGLVLEVQPRSVSRKIYKVVTHDVTKLMSLAIDRIETDLQEQDDVPEEEDDN